jgi:hypothetical protein
VPKYGRLAGGGEKMGRAGKGESKGARKRRAAQKAKQHALGGGRFEKKEAKNNAMQAWVGCCVVVVLLLLFCCCSWGIVLVWGT